MSPLVSVILATYRRDDGLRLALESLRAQTLKNFEIVVVDDNASAAWSERVDALIAGTGAILVRNERNLGSAMSRNEGAKKCRGKYLAFLDDDDVYLPARLERQATRMEKEKADYSITDLALFGENGRLIEVRRRAYLIDSPAESLLVAHMKHHMTGSSAIMMRRDYFERVGGFPPIDLGDEYYLMEKAILAGGRFCYVPACDVRAVVHSESPGLSCGDSKIEGENALYDHKKTLFPRLRPADRRYIAMRHYAVVAFARMRDKKWLPAARCALRSCFASPAGFCRLARDTFSSRAGLEH